MPGEPVTPPAGGAAHGLVGKLPAHGDFIRRGGPPVVLAMIDRWLDAALGGAVAAGTTLDEAVAALDDCRFAFASPAGGVTLATAVASVDGVGRHFPLIGTLTDPSGFAFATAEQWCVAAAGALDAVCDTGMPADVALAALAAVPSPPAGGATIGWWRAGDAAATYVAGLPAGDAFSALLARGRA